MRRLVQSAGFPKPPSLTATAVVVVRARILMPAKDYLDVRLQVQQQRALVLPISQVRVE